MGVRWGKRRNISEEKGRGGEVEKEGVRIVIWRGRRRRKERARGGR